MTNARRLHLIRRRYHRYNWLRLQSDVRYLARERRNCAAMRPHFVLEASVASSARLQVSLMRVIDQTWSFLQPVGGK